MVFKLLRRAINWLKTGGGGILGREPRDEKMRPHFRQGHKNKNFLGLTDSLSTEQMQRTER